MDNVTNREFNLYRDIQMRTGGEIYLGIIGPVRTGKSTLIKRIMDLLVIPNLPESPEKIRILDEMPQSGSGKQLPLRNQSFYPKKLLN
jgi:stage IV sporulation protein A